MFDKTGLNDQQYAAVTYDHGNLLLAAGPGSGKTHTMTARILYLIEEMQTDPSSILVITFTKDAALSMQKRFGR
ncbi:MAG: UvrD-helicase domain-containing protein, partial [Lachnospiraceae bacterium]|nr:UvrD-helicase domain-containing protein [Lachnospiraceae bacterium]